jgi:hypothetical protein
LFSPKIFELHHNEENLYWGKVMAKEKGGREAKKPKKESDGSKKQKKDPNRHDGIGGKPN